MCKAETNKTTKGSTSRLWDKDRHDRRYTIDLAKIPHVDLHACMHACLQTCMHIHTRTHECMHSCMHAFMNACIHV